ncbi:hypothetical protein D9M72_596760 [compost metagenome]
MGGSDTAQWRICEAFERGCDDHRIDHPPLPGTRIADGAKGGEGQSQHRRPPLAKPWHDARQYDGHDERAADAEDTER